jgi:multicomponent Na+:H+ antiporter subunit F
MTGILFITLGIILVGAVIGIIALIRSKIVMEKMVALDVLTTLMTGVLLIISLYFKKSFILDIAIVYAILSFGAVMVVARYREGGI